MPASAMSRRSLVVAGLSTIVEWYDFTLYLYLATLLSRIFSVGGDAGLTQILAGFALAYAMRPFGAIVFGHIGDRYGRRVTMLASMTLMSLAMLATALLPTHAQAGPVAGWMLLGLRCLMAFSVGGEYTGVVAYLVEGAPVHRRGFVTSLASAASEIGALLAAGISALTVALLDEASLMDWGWRIPFFVGAAMAAVILLARTSMEESPDFRRQAEGGTVPASPLRHSLRHHRLPILRGFAISALGSITYYVGITYVPAFLTGVGHMGEGVALWLSTLAALAAILLPVPMFLSMLHGPGLALAGALILAGLGGAVSAVGAVATAEQFPGEGRLTGLALGATAATAIFGGLTPWLSHLLIERTGWPLIPGALIALVALVVLPIFARMPETKP